MPFFINITVSFFSKLRNNTRKDEFKYGYGIIDMIKNCIEEYQYLLQQFLDYVKYVKQNNVLTKNELILVLQGIYRMDNVREQFFGN